MNKKLIKIIASLMLVFFSGKLLLIDYFNLGFISFIIIGITMALSAFFIYSEKIKLNVFLIAAISLFLISALIVRMENKLESDKYGYDLTGIWNTPDSLGQKITFDFYSEDEVSVLLGSNQDEIFYEYELNKDNLKFILNDSIRFNWKILMVNENRLEIIEENQTLTFIREQESDY